MLGRDKDEPKQRRPGKRLLAAAIIAALCGGCLVGGIYAYQTDTGSIHNKLAIGDVHITAAEPHFPTEDTDDDGVPDECELLTPYDEVPKDPYIQNTGSNDCIVFFRVTAPVEDLTVIADDGTRTAESPQDLFWFKLNSDSVDSHANHFNPNWIRLTSLDGQLVSCDGINLEGRGLTYIFGYHVRLTDGAKTENLFDKIQNKKYGSRTISANEVEQIKLETFAVQADDVYRNNAAIPTDGELGEDDLTYIYKTFVNQNQAEVGGVTW